MASRSAPGRWLGPAVAVAVTLITVALPPVVTTAPALASGAGAHTAPSPQVCGQRPRPGFAACLAIVRRGVVAHRGLFAAGRGPSGYGPADLRGAYRLPSATDGARATVAVVDAYDDPRAAADLATYRQQYGLPPCTAASGCFRKVAQDGSARYPAGNGDWAGEISLDLDMVSAICPRCQILLVEARNNSLYNLGAALNEAIALGARYVSNSYGGPLSSQTAVRFDASYYDHPGVAITAASGDDLYGGYGISYPAESADVTAVGGTSLMRDPHVPRGWSETAWSGAASGCAAAEAKPAWQHDTGCAGRTIADVSAVADPSTGVAVYDSYPDPGVFSRGWSVFGGTSATSAIIASTYALAGPPLEGSYPAAYPYARPSALHDITTGSGSSGTCRPVYLCAARPGYDAPTGLGTPDGVAAFTLPHGTLTGAIATSAGRPLAGALVQVGPRSAVTNADGRYRIAVPAGRYRVTGLDLAGYAARTSHGVLVRPGQVTTEDFGLRHAPDVTISGRVTDGSGHGWPVYARVSLAGTRVAGYSDPRTGRYVLRVPRDGSYVVRADPITPGYQPVNRTVTVGARSQTSDFPDLVDAAACVAPGYHEVTSLSEGFDRRAEPPGWTVVTTGLASNRWRFDRPRGHRNLTGGDGNYAAAYESSQAHFSNTELISPVMNLSGDPHPVLRFDTYANYPMSRKRVELSLNDGKTWSLVWADGGSPDSGLPSGSLALPMQQAAGKSAVRVRFRYTDRQINTDVLWQVDDVTVGGGCEPVPGGLVIGRITDANTGRGVDGATVTGRPGQAATTVAAPHDLVAGGGLYWMFSSRVGNSRLTVSAPGYAAATGHVTVRAGQVTSGDFRLGAGRLTVSPRHATATTRLGSRTTIAVTVRNTGTARARLAISPTSPFGFSPLGASPAGPDAPLRRITGHFSAHILVRPLARSANGRRRGGAPAGTAAISGGAPWRPVVGYPARAEDVAAATDPATGKVYAAGGQYILSSSFADPTEVVAKGYVLDPATGTWHALPSMHYARASAAAVFMGGKFYVAAGLDNIGNPVTATEVYDPALGRWSAGASIPHAYYAAASAALDGKMYVIGGCDPTVNQCGQDAVQVYDPATNSWSTAAPYPIPIAAPSCGAIAGRLYCAGGSSDAAGSTSAGYVYDPRTNAWRAISPLPIDLWGGASAAAGGQLLISGGVTANGAAITNQGYAYHPSTDRWTRLPNAPGAPVWETASACGFYRIGGSVDDSQVTSDQLPVADVAQLPGYSCGGPTWLSAAPAALTLGAGRSVKVVVTLSATGASVTQPGTYTATLRLGTDTPYQVPALPVRLVVRPPRSWGRLAGRVTGRACDARTAPLPGATVQIDGRHGTWTVTTDRRGRYGIWLDKDNSPATLIASLPGWQPRTATATIKPLATTTRNFTLTRTSCG